MKPTNLIIAGLACLLLASCSVNLAEKIIPPRFTPDKCILLGVKTERGVYWAGTCEDGRYLVQWDAPQTKNPPITIQWTRHPNGSNSFAYKTDSGFIEWSSKSGISLGPVPAVVAPQAIALN